MYLYSLSLNADDLSVARKHLSTKLPDVKRSHLAEAVAASLGFNTSIALQTSIRGNPANEHRYGYFNASEFFKRLTELGHPVAQQELDTFKYILFPKTISQPFVIFSPGTVQSTRSELGRRLDTLVPPERATIDVCKLALSEIKVFRKTANENITSYGIKHHIEKAFGVYLSNGALIQAALELGLQVQLMEGPNVYFHVGTKVFLEAIANAVTKGARATAQALVHGVSDNLKDT